MSPTLFLSTSISSTQYKLFTSSSSLHSEMPDDDIQYLGARPANRSTSDNPFLARQTVTGIVFHVERSGVEPGYDLTFQRANTNVIHIGRRPSNESGQRDDLEKAMFRCAVVSRKHAKIAFSDSGHAYIIDTYSHHGTHIRKPGETQSKQLVPETPALLADGDVVTFGKAVGRNNEFVRPVVARMQLVHGVGEPSNEPLDVFSSPSTPLRNKSSSDQLFATFTKGSSGRYGVHSLSSPSSGEDSPNHDSDIEEIPVSGANAVPLRPRGSCNESGFRCAVEALKKLLPQIPQGIPTTLPRPNTDSDGRPMSSPLRQLPSLSSLARESSEFSFFSPLFSQPPSSLSMPRTLSPFFNNLASLPSYTLSDASKPMDKDCTEPSRLDESSDENRSKSSSPMDLASPSSVMAVQSIDSGASDAPDDGPDAVKPSEEPNVIGGWPGSSDVSPDPHSRSESPAPAQVSSSESAERQASLGVAEEPDSLLDKPASRSASPSSDVDASSRSSHSAMSLESDASVDAASDSDKIASDVSDLKSSVEKLKEDVAKLHSYKRKFKSRQNANMQELSDKLVDLEDRMSEINDHYLTLLDQVENMASVDMTEIQTRIDTLTKQLEELPALSEKLEMSQSEQEQQALAPLHERDDVKASIQTLRELVDEMRTLRENTQKQMNLELARVRAVRDSALKTIREQTAQALIPKSLKRKRSDDDEGLQESNIEDDVLNGGKVAVADIADDTAASVDGAVDVMMAEATSCIGITPATTAISEATTPPRKRARRIAKSVLQTATAVTVGAVATWTALAFT